MISDALRNLPGPTSVEIEFPLEVMVLGAPLSLRASAASKEEWKERIQAAARERLPEGHFAIVKPILDSLSRFIYIDDKQVERLVVQKFEPGRAFTFASPSLKLTETINANGPRVYLRVDVSAAGEM